MEEQKGGWGGADMMPARGDRIEVVAGQRGSSGVRAPAAGPESPAW